MHLFQSLFMVGVLLGSYIFGEASDRFGRKPTFIASIIIQSGFGLLAGVLPGGAGTPDGSVF
jgi:OCT family organic cation transporter-like MFS transporter 4/5